jgi:hypothetical protein
MKTTIAALALIGTAGAASAQLTNGDFESGLLFSELTDWGPNGAQADHANFARGNNATLGDFFGYYDARGVEFVGQLASVTFQANTIYNFSSWLNDGSANGGHAGLQIGYLTDDADPESFVMLGEAGYEFDIFADADWVFFDGVTYQTGFSGTELGQTVYVRYATFTGATNLGDVWFDNASRTASVIPAPGTVGLAAAGGLLALRRRR